MSRIESQLFTELRANYLADAYSLDTVIIFSKKRSLQPVGLILHAALLRQAFAHCGKFLTAAFRRSLGRVSVPMRLVILSDQLLIVAVFLVSRYPTNLANQT